MPHFIVEYTSNIRKEAGMQEFLRKANQVLITQNGVFPVGGIRSRAIEVEEFAIADSAADYAFVHGNLKIGMGRTPEQKKKVGDELFALMKEHFADLFAKRYLALSLEISEFSEIGTWKHNNIHERFRRAARG